jgi:DNA-binding response OmpR family regulator
MSSYVVLLADSEHRNAAIVEHCLATLGCRVIAVGTGTNAVTAFESAKPELVLLDLAGVSGLQFLKYLRAHRERPKTAVLVMTRAAEHEFRARALEAGADDFVEKPLDVSILSARAKLMLQTASVRRDLAHAHAQLSVGTNGREQLQAELHDLRAVAIQDVRAGLTVLGANLAQIARSSSGDLEQVSRALRDSAEAERSLHATLYDLLAALQLGRVEMPGPVETVSVARVLHSALDHIRPLSDLYSVSLTWAFDDSAHVEANPQLLKRVSSYLLREALDQTTRGMEICVSLVGGQDVEIRVSSTGSLSVPIAQASAFRDAQRAPRPPADVQNARLSFCERVVRSHGGSTEFRPTAEFPFCCRIRLPSSATRAGSSRATFKHDTRASV